MMKNGLTFYAERSRLERKVKLYAVLEAPDGTRSFATNVVMEKEADEHAAPSPMMSVPFDDVQSLMDELWRIGYRPTDNASTTGELAATRAHLSDMKTIADKLLTNLLEPK